MERRYWSRLLELYLPVRRSGSDEIIAVVEFYQLPDAIDREVGQAQLVSWALVAGAIGLSFLLLFGIVKQGSDTIGRQESALQRQVGELSELLAQNTELNDRVRAAAERTTTLNERSLRRISADLHDGPGQTVALALMRVDSLKAARRHARESRPGSSSRSRGRSRTRSATCGRSRPACGCRSSPSWTSARSPRVPSRITCAGPGCRWP